MTDAHDLSAPAARHRPWPLCRRCCGIALDMGSARTRVWLAGKGTVVDVPTVTFPGTGAVYPVQRGTIIDTPGCSRMLQRLLGHRLPRFTRPMVHVAAAAVYGTVHRVTRHHNLVAWETAWAATAPRWTTSP